MLSVKSLIFIFVFTLFHLNSNAQYYGLMWEAGFKVGGANYLGDIGGVYEPRPFIADMRVEKTRPGLGVYGRRVLTNWLSVNVGLQYSIISGADSLSLDPARFSRNLSFRNQVKELYVRSEIYFLNWNDVGHTGRYLFGLRSFIFGGVTGFHHSPQTNYKGEWINLRLLQTEGIKYSPWQIAVPLGIGLTVTVARNHRFGIEGTWNWTFTDYLDDVSSVYLPPQAHTDPLARTLADRSHEVDPEDPKFVGTSSYASASNFIEGGAIRGNPKNNDSYLTLFFTYGYAFQGKKKNFTRKRYNHIGPKVNRVRSRVKF